MIKGISMFSSAGVGEMYLKKAGIDIILANELLEKRAKFYSYMYPESKMVVGDINNNKIKEEFIKNIPNDAKFLLATPPCQGFSTLGVNKKLNQMSLDKRNFLVFHILDIIDIQDFDYILIENVPRFLELYFPYEDKFYLLKDILEKKYSKKYIIDIKVLNAKDYGIPQTRPRAIIKMYKHKLKWEWPKKKNEITLREAIGHLPSLESGEISNIKFHEAKKHNEREILAMKHTPTGCSAMKNEVYYPKKVDGTKIKGFHNTYKRMRWDMPAPARTMNSGNIGSHNNVHPGKLLKDGTYSDARVLTLRELFIVASLPEEWNIPDWATDTFIRHIIGESIPPKMCYEIIKMIGE
ncbi:DNA cytosine methyltransferase [Leptotrichia wadei]|jgi:modification methylase hgaIB|uniref:DNA cytosine methyltransferase n=1 Tax=Leptotrichia wadei TaxID=157687 RepID=UPI00260D15EC|nr:DNA cytosine methyltransferase [Leptotrichia wadei]